MKALLIDPFAKTISAVELENTLPAIYAVAVERADAAYANWMKEEVR